MPVIIFDLFGTLIEKERYDYDKALKWLADSYFKHEFQELQKLSSKFKTSYIEKRKVLNMESSFYEQLKFFEKEMGVRILADYYSVEKKFISLFRIEKPVDGAIELLQYLCNENYRIYILSNSVFSGLSLKSHLCSLDLGNYVEKVYSSADIGYRKPSVLTFQAVLDDLEINNPAEIFYIGDSFEKDYQGAMASGMTPILISPAASVDGLLFDNLPLLLEYFKSR